MVGMDTSQAAEQHQCRARLVARYLGTTCHCAEDMGFDMTVTILDLFDMKLQYTCIYIYTYIYTIYRNEYQEDFLGVKVAGA